MATDGSATDKRRESMEKKSSLPTKSDVREMINWLAPPDEEMDEVSAGILLEEAGVDLTSVPSQLLTRLDSEIADIRSSDQVVPTAMTEVVEALRRANESTEEPVDPRAWVNDLLNKRIPRGFTLSDQPYFRSLKKDLLTDEDIKALEDLYAELHAKDD